MEPADSLVPWALLAGGLLYLVCGVPLWLQQVPPNRVYGFRTQATLADPALWFRANRVLGQDMVIAGLLVSVVAGLGVWKGDLEPDLLLWAIGAHVLASLAMMVRSALIVTKAGWPGS